MDSTISSVVLLRQKGQIQQLRDTLGEYGRRLNASHRMASMQRVEIERLQAIVRRLFDGWRPSDDERTEILCSFNRITQGAT